MRHIDTDYLVVGAGASGMAFVDTLLSLTDARVVIVDREAQPGGHWLHAYPFVRLHQPSANYGVPSRRLGNDRIDLDGPNAGFYERSTASEICDYYAAVLDEHVSSGRVTFLGHSEYRGHDTDGHVVVALDTGFVTSVRARKLVDATIIASEIPSRHAPAYAVDEDVRLVPPNDLVDLAETPSGFTVIGAGKTAMDTCVWLLDQEVDPDRIRWVKPRDAWMFDRTTMQPLDLVAGYMQMQARWVHAAATATTGHEFADQLGSVGVLVRVDPTVQADMFYGPIISSGELEALRSLENVLRMGKVRRIGRERLELDAGEVPSRPGEVYVDCTARGVRDTGPQRVFERDKLTLAYTTIGIAPWGAALVGAVEAMCDGDDDEKNGLCPALIWTGRTADLLRIAYAGMTGIAARNAVPELFSWNEACRLNPASGAIAKAGAEPEISAALTSIITEIGDAMTNLEARAAAATV